MENQREVRKLELIKWCRYYERKSHIWSRKLFGVYANRLMKKGNITERMFSHLVKYLRHDLRVNDKEIWERYKLVIKGMVVEEVGSDLSEFLK